MSFFSRKIINPIDNFFLKSFHYNKLDIESVRARSKTRQFIFYNFLFLIVGLIASIVRSILVFKNIYIAEVAFFFPLIVSALAITNLFFLRAKGTVEPFATIFVMMLQIVLPLRLLLSSFADFSSLISILFVTTSTFYLKGNRWGVVAAFLAVIYATIIFNTNLIFTPNVTHYLFSLIAILALNSPIYIFNRIHDELIQELIYVEKEQLSKEMMRRLLHEIMNPLNVASGICEIERDKKSDNIHLNMIQESLDKIERVIRKMNKKCNTNDLTTLIEDNRDEIDLEKIIEEKDS